MRLIVLAQAARVAVIWRNPITARPAARKCPADECRVTGLQKRIVVT